jgi:hypothetical protein
MQHLLHTVYDHMINMLLEQINIEKVSKRARVVTGEIYQPHILSRI